MDCLGRIAAVLCVVAPLLSISAFGTASAAPTGCSGSTKIGLLDHAQDVFDLRNQTLSSNWAQIDLTEVEGCMAGNEIVLELRVRGMVIPDDPRYTYAAIINHEESLGFLVAYSGGVATARELGSATSWNVSSEAASSSVLIHVPSSIVPNLGQTWNVTAEAGFTPEGTLVYTFFDTVDLDAQQTPLCGEDITNRSSPFQSPNVTISSVNVVNQSGQWEVTARGNAAGDVGAVRVSMGVLVTWMGTASWCFPQFLTTELPANANGTVTFHASSPGNFTWEFRRTYSIADLQGLYGDHWTIGDAKVEVQAIGTDGKWGHASRVFEPLSETAKVSGEAPAFLYPTFAVVGAAILFVAAYALTRRAGLRARRVQEPREAPDPPTPSRKD